MVGFIPIQRGHLSVLIRGLNFISNRTQDALTTLEGLAGKIQHGHSESGLNPAPFPLKV